MAKRSLRVVKWLGPVPVVGVCTQCAQNFKVPFDSLRRTSTAQESLKVQFAEHKCLHEDAGETQIENRPDGGR